LQQIADCLNRAVRQGDVIARIGGDEFCILADSINFTGLKSLAHRVLQTINELTIYQGANAGKVGVSIGAVWHHQQSRWNTAQELLAAADQAMYQAKSSGKNRVVFVEPRADVAKASASRNERSAVEQPSLASGYHP